MVLSLAFLASAAEGQAGADVGLAKAAPGAVKPAGHLEEFLKRQVTGTTGSRGRLGYPFSGCMWGGSIPDVHVIDCVPFGGDVVAPRDDIWWPYEQSAYFLDGMVRLSQLVSAPKLRDDFRSCLDWCLDHQAEDGDLFRAYSTSSSQWPVVVFFRAALAYAEETGDERVKAAFVRHYACKRKSRKHLFDRDVLNIEGMLKVAEWTGDRSYVAEAEEWFGNHHYGRLFSTTDRVHSHGVTFAEMLKIPALLYRATGRGKWRTMACKAMRDAFEKNEMPNGQISCNEYLSGRDPWQANETCVAADLMCALGCFLEMDANCEAADHMERIAYNALPGAITKDFRRHQYFSQPNQVVSTPFSHAGHFFFGETDCYRFRACHSCPCCSGNLNRAMPLFVQHLWLKRPDGSPVAMLHGPGAVRGTFGGVPFAISAATDYPFGDTIAYTFDVEKPVEMPFAFRVPGWTRGVTAKKNGVPANLVARSGTLAVVSGRWQKGDRLEVTFDQPVVFESDRHWHWLRRGALALAHPVRTRVVEERAGDPFSDLSFVDPEPFNFAFDLGEIAKTGLKAEFTRSEYPFERPNLVVRVPMREIEEWRTLDEQRFTPPVPLYTHPTGRNVTVDFVPFGTTLTRITAFPDTVRRVQLPVVRTYASPQCYNYDPQWPLADQTADPEAWSDEEFLRKGQVIQRDPDLWSDLQGHYLVDKGKFAYVLIRFWSDRAGKVTCALGASRAVQAFFESREVYANGPIVEGRMLAPFWFDLEVREGYNCLKVKVATNGKEVVFGQDQFRREWGVRLEVFRTEDAGR